MVELTAAVLVHGNSALYFLSAAARRAAAIAPALHWFEIAVSCCTRDRACCGAIPCSGLHAAAAVLGFDCLTKAHAQAAPTKHCDPQSSSPPECRRPWLGQ